MRGASALVARARWTIREIRVQRQHLRGAGDDLGGLFDAHAAGIDLHVVEHGVGPLHTKHPISALFSTAFEKPWRVNLTNNVRWG